MLKEDALTEFKKMWIWLYRHPAHDNGYYVKHVIKVDPAWKENCPLCEFFEGECEECRKVWDQGKGNLCNDPGSPLNKWEKTNLGDPDFRTWYAGKLIDIAETKLQ